MRRVTPHPSVFTFFTLAILIAALPINSALAGRRLRRDVPSPRAKLFRYIRTIVVLWSVTALAVYALRLHGFDTRDVGLVAPHAPWELAVGLVSLVAPLLALLAGAPRRLSPAYAIALRAIVPESAGEWTSFWIVAASAGICEEFLYRGYALWAIARLTNDTLFGVAASTLAFGFAHAYQGRTGIANATISGGLYAVVFLATGSLYPCMIGHVAQDIAGAAVLTRRWSGAALDAQAVDVRQRPQAQ
jgi:membrane protease YdiL (CAAX protease family)